MSGILKIGDLNAIWEGNVEAILDFFCGSGHLVPKHVSVELIVLGEIGLLV